MASLVVDIRFGGDVVANPEIGHFILQPNEKRRPS